MSIELTPEQHDAFMNYFKYYLGLFLTQEMAKKAPVDKGILRGSINFETTDYGVKITMVDYAVHVEFGTKAHIIEPKNKQALRFKIGNKTIITKKVQHPGTDAQPFIRPVLFNDLPRLAEQARELALAEVMT
jgi:hypothetical protein